jgi:hypothetical protein
LGKVLALFVWERKKIDIGFMTNIEGIREPKPFIKAGNGIRSDSKL